MKIRSGITLVEVLVAIFIMGVGLLAILVLFPVGALNMARAIKDDRAQYSGQQAAAVANMWDLRHNLSVTTGLDATNVTRQDAPSYPILIDPSGFGAGLTPLGRLGAAPGLPRISPSIGNGPNQLPPPANGASIAERWFTLLDDVEFNIDGSPAGVAGTNVRRYGAFTWSYIARRPQHSNRSMVDLSVLVYRGRNTLAPTNEPTFNCAGNAGDNSLTVTITGEPDLRPLGYILDTSVITQTVGGVSSSTVAAQAYQVMEIQKTGTTWTMRVEPPLRNNVNTVVFLEGVIAVFEKGTGWQP